MNIAKLMSIHRGGPSVHSYYNIYHHYLLNAIYFNKYLKFKYFNKFTVILFKMLITSRHNILKRNKHNGGILV